MTRGEQAVAAKGDDLFESFLRATAAVECAVEGDVYAFGSLNHSAAGSHIDVAVGRECANHHTVYAKPA